ncbi:ABC transporter permease [Ectobacillus antri]|jgi:putative ABC transport system permease protein|uniref:ABC transporter permease n=1 Tax=Ectobacillus antri TaxID=2486280 RepID=A0ABT6HAG9_9BACI|nr:ABC transporter permease [Ectobacillus antri]MDG4658533.1 ABC transporter permease [Ectobacillus antri]MDG5755516.1 ABC transporter permease [Ectobacillus antri]
MFKENIKMAWMNLIHNKMRSFLTMLGIVIGVASIIALITIVQGAMNGMTSEFSSFGADKITVQAMGTPLKQGLMDNDIQSLMKIEDVAGVSPTLTGKTTVVHKGNEKKDVMIQGKNEVYFSKTKDLIDKGRGLNRLDIQNKNQVCLIGSNIANELFFGENPIGQKLLIAGVTHTVVGTLQKSNSFSDGNNNDSVIIPYTTSMGLLGTGYMTNVEVYMSDANHSEKITEDIESVLNQAFNYKENSFSIMNMQDMIASFKKITTMLSLMLGGIASISLVVGGIGIMNMMLVSVTERTAEIGLRKALGAEPKRIQQQFLLEAVFLSLFGGTIGLLLGAFIAYGVCFLIGASFALSASTIILAFFFSAAIGIIFGIAPARKASKLNPIDALRSI